MKIYFGEKTLTDIFLFITRGSFFYKEKRANRKKHRLCDYEPQTQLTNFVSFPFVSFGLEIFIISIY